MPEQVQNILNKITEWWKKFNTKQKALLISIVAVIIVALAILAAVVSKPNMVTLHECQTTAEAGTVKDLLDGESISYQMSQDGLIFYVDAKDEAAASILLGKNDIPGAGQHPLINVFDGGSDSQRQTRQRNTKFICRNILLNSWKPCQMLKVLL